MLRSESIKMQHRDGRTQVVALLGIVIKLVSSPLFVQDKEKVKRVGSVCSQHHQDFEKEFCV